MQRPQTNPNPQILPLENGDRLSCHEFEGSYTESPHIKKPELISGVVYLASL
ncbi:MAG: hypothetical protein ACKO3K_01870 [Cuspidothrix sp.]